MIDASFPFVSLTSVHRCIVDFELHDRLLHIFCAQDIYSFLTEQIMLKSMRVVGISSDLILFHFSSISHQSTLNFVTYQLLPFHLKLFIIGHQLPSFCPVFNLLGVSLDLITFTAATIHLYALCFGNFEVCTGHHSHEICLIKVVDRWLTCNWDCVSTIVNWVV